MFSPEKYPYYNARERFDWEKIVSLVYKTTGKDLGKKALSERIKNIKKGKIHVF